MKILQLCNKSPLPPVEGGPIAMFHLAKALQKAGHAIDVLAVSTPKYQVDETKVHKYISDSYHFYFQNIDTTIRLTNAFFSFVLNAPYHVVRFDNKNFHHQLIQLLDMKKYDIVLFETLYMTPYLKTVRENSQAICILRSHNIEHQIWKHLYEHEKNWIKKIYLLQLTHALKQYEKKHVGFYDAIACISKQEIEYFQSINKDILVTHIPFGISGIEESNNQVNPLHFYHIGSMDWLPNIEGIRWFLNDVIPILERRNAHLKIFIAGRNMPDWLLNYKHRLVQVVGEVEDAKKFVSDKSTLIVPLFSGSGVRIKIVEAMAMGKAVISTQLGALGLLVTNQKNICLADTAEDFAEKMIELSQNSVMIEKIGTSSKQLIEQEHCYDVVNSKFSNLLEQIRLNRK